MCILLPSITAFSTGIVFGEVAAECAYCFRAPRRHGKVFLFLAAGAACSILLSPPRVHLSLPSPPRIHYLLGAVVICAYFYRVARRCYHTFFFRRGCCRTCVLFLSTEPSSEGILFSGGCRCVCVLFPGTTALSTGIALFVGGLRRVCVLLASTAPSSEVIHYFWLLVRP